MKGQFGKLQFFLFVLPLILFLGFFYYGFNQGIIFQLPENMKQVAITGFGNDLLTVIGIPQDWHYFPGLVYVLFIPFLFIVVVTYGFLSELQIFTYTGNTINIILSLLVAFSTIPFGIFVKAVAAILATMGLYGAGAFGVLYVLGVGWVVLQRMEKWGYTPKGHSDYRGLKLHSRYRVLVNFLQDVADMNISDAAFVNDITNHLNTAETDWTNDRHEKAVRELEGFVRIAYRRAGNKPRRVW